MTNLEPPPQRTISTTEELQALVAEALVTGTLDISNCILDVDFDLPSLLKHFKQLEIQIEVLNRLRSKECRITFECPFLLKARLTSFNKRVDFNFITFNNKVDFCNTTFKKNVGFGRTTFNECVDFTRTVFENSICFGGFFDKRSYGIRVCRWE